MEKAQPCKGCSASVTVDEKEMRELLDQIHIDHSEIVTEKMYRKRLEACFNCPSLLYGTTCQYCGCLVQFKAKFQNKHCAMPENPRW